MNNASQDNASSPLPVFGLHDMRFSEPERYKLRFEDHLSLSVQNQQGGPKFSSNASSRMPKLYVVSSNDIPIYIGVTTQPMRKRLQQGWYANGQRGYYGYEWRFNMTEADLDVWCHLNAAENSILDVETIEAEVVHLIRKTGQWPLNQTEIHFHLSGISHRKAAREIMKLYDISSLTNNAPDLRVSVTGEVERWSYDHCCWEV